MTRRNSPALSWAAQWHNHQQQAQPLPLPPGSTHRHYGVPCTVPDCKAPPSTEARSPVTR